ncbi:hypothetical protein QP868_08550 [Brevibacterium sp. UMB1308A]|uniref:hypothetical protein n=1 Tax=Brevibacterium sp. UMB1308A TaxID=3050608 RepID=UPI00254A390A|nr:hypothetical protein [Brevibacterium sp. UMB1308A]MDK8346784.1 hypothetical protein [Brevibacterium sp. UMB1308B]MDK8713947.1 hypothetical protein [Brevibacterium sp. UMB1308A]
MRTRPFAVLIDDDRPGEAADLVGIRVDGGDLHVTLVHCKYSSKPDAGSRLKDLYEVRGQAMRGARWRDNAALPLLEHLPGLSIRSASDEQLRLIAGAASYVQTVTKGGFEVYGPD